MERVLRFIKEEKHHETEESAFRDVGDVGALVEPLLRLCGAQFDQRDRHEDEMHRSGALLRLCEGRQQLHRIVVHSFGFGRRR